MTTHKVENITHNMQNYSDIISDYDNSDKLEESSVAYGISTHNVSFENVMAFLDGLAVEDKVAVAGRLMTKVQQEETTEQKFERLLRDWKKSTKYHSSPYVYVNDSNFIAIAKMGEKAVPYILKEIKTQPSYLYHALDLIYGQPLTSPTKSNGWLLFNIDESCKRWIAKFEK